MKGLTNVVIVIFWWAIAWLHGMLNPDASFRAPQGYGGVSCSITGLRDCIDLYRHGWIPWKFRRTDAGFNGMFIYKIEDQV